MSVISVNPILNLNSIVRMFYFNQDSPLRTTFSYMGEHIGIVLAILIALGVLFVYLLSRRTKLKLSNNYHNKKIPFYSNRDVLNQPTAETPLLKSTPSAIRLSKFQLVIAVILILLLLFSESRDLFSTF